MRIAFLHDWLLTWRGGERCLSDLIDVFPSSEVFTLFSDASIIEEHLSDVRVHSSFASRIPGVHRFYRALLPLFPLVNADISRRLAKRHTEEPFDLVVSISHCAVKNIRTPKDIRHVSYCLTPLRYMWDEYDSYFAQSRIEPITRFFRPYLQRWDRSGSHNVDEFVGISKYVSERIQRIYDRSSRVVYPPVEVERHTPENVEGDYFLMVNALVPYKFTSQVAEAFKGLPHQLIIVGSGPEKDFIKKKAGSNVRLLGTVTDEKLDSLYAGCRGLIYAAEEDFGIAPVEAQAAGKPVLCYGEGGCTETVIDTVTGRYFYNRSPQGIREAIHLFDKDISDRAYSPEKCRAQAMNFSKEIFQNTMIDFLNECTGVHSSQVDKSVVQNKELRRA